MRLDVRPDPARDGRMAIFDGERLVALARLLPLDSADVLGLAVTGGGDEAAQAREVVDALTGLARQREARSLTLLTSHPLVRHEARRAGFDGDLRGPLQRPLAERASAPRPDDLGAAVGRLVPEVTVFMRERRSPFRRLARWATAGLPVWIDLVIDVGDGRRPVDVRIPHGSDVMSENVARTVDILTGVRRRFGSALPVRTVSFDHSDRGLRSGRLSGLAHQNTGAVHLNASYVFVEGVEDLLRHRGDPAADEPGRPAQPFTAIDGTTAHELWHHMEMAFEARRYRQSVEFRRELGSYFGVATIEHATRGGHRSAPPDWQSAHARLVEEVSGYAATSPREATAELFKLWWCSGSEQAPALRHFGQLVDRYILAEANHG